MSLRIEFVLVLLGGLLLACVAGYVNTMMILLGAPPVTHLTGSISRLSADIGQLNFEDAKAVGSLVVSFLLGAMLAGVLLHSSNLRLGRRYGVAIIIESLILCVAAMLIPHSLMGAASCAAAGAGLQNAMAASYRNMIIRTTHMTGILTDLGFLLGQTLKGQRRRGRQVLMLSSLLIAFLFGGVLGAIVGADDPRRGLLIPSALLALMGIGYFVLRRLRCFRAES